jgi:hypothetical protein
MNPAKIRLSQTEMELVTNADLILTKNLILKKVKWLLENLLVKQQEYVALHAAGLPVKVSGSSPKISKGENYKGLPYLILDYPRLFEQENLPDRSPAAKAYGDGTQVGPEFTRQEGHEIHVLFLFIFAEHEQEEDI